MSVGGGEIGMRGSNGEEKGIGKGGIWEGETKG